MRIFLAAPFTDQLADGTAGLQREYRRWIESLIGLLESQGHHVFSAHRAENWGSAIDPPRIALRRDFDWIDRCDLLVAYVGDPPSPGVQMELGYAAAKGKRVLVFRNNPAFPYLVDGLDVIVPAQVVTVAHRQDITAAIKSLDLASIGAVRA